MTPDQLQKQGSQLNSLLDAPVVFVFDSLKSWQRNRRIARKVGFAEPFKQLYIPELLLQLTAPIKSESVRTPIPNVLTPPAQLLLLYHLQVHSLERMLLRDIAELLGYSPMTITRAVKELAAHKLLVTVDKGIRFVSRGPELWHRALPFLVSPIRDVWYTDLDIDNEMALLSGDTALAAYTMLVDGSTRTYATGKDAYRQHYAENKKNFDTRYGTHKLEVWHYDPGILTKDKRVDRLSLFLSQMESKDERVQRAITTVLNDVVWL